MMKEMKALRAFSGQMGSKDKDEKFQCTEAQAAELKRLGVAEEVVAQSGGKAKD